MRNCNIPTTYYSVSPPYSFAGPGRYASRTTAAVLGVRTVTGDRGAELILYCDNYDGETGDYIDTDCRIADKTYASLKAYFDRSN